MTKRILTLFVFVILSIPVFSQNMYDALRFSLQYYDGTARSLAMGNAMTSLGGDLGALSYNPAASGVYRYSEVTVTPATYTNLSHARYLGSASTESKTRIVLSNVGWIGGVETGRSRGLVGINFAVTANQTNNFAFRTSASGMEAKTSFLASVAAHIPNGITGNDLTMPENNPNYPFNNVNSSWSSILGWNTGLIDNLGGADRFIAATENKTAFGSAVAGNLIQDYLNERTGYIQDVVFNLSGNIDDIFFFGVNVSVLNIWFSEYSSFSEKAVNSSLFNSGFKNFSTEYNRITSGMGVNLKAGFIVRPVAGLTLGGSISTPSWMFLNDSWRESMGGHTAIYGTHSINSPTGMFEYKVTSPFKWNVGIGYTFGKYVAIGVDYERSDYSDIFMADSYGKRKIFEEDNNNISQYLKAVNNIRAGLEFKVLPQFSLRAGYNYYDSSIKNFDNSRHYACAGIGFISGGGFFIDIAYQQQCKFNADDYSLYNSYNGNNAPVLSEKYLNWKLLLTIGVRF